MNRINELKAGIAFVREVLRYAADVTKAEQRSLTSDEQTGWDEGLAWIADAERQIAQLTELERVSNIDTHIESATAPAVQTRVSAFEGDPLSMRRSEARDKALKALEVRKGEVSDRAAEQVEHLIRTQTNNIDGSQIARRLLVTENDSYRSAFAKVATSPTPVLTAEEGRALMAWNEFRAMSEGTTTAGGFGVPVLIDPTIVITDQGSPDDIVGISTVKTITTNVWKGVSASGMSWSFDTEAAEVSDDSLTLAQPSVTVFMARGFIPFSIEVDQDYPGFRDELAPVIGGGYRELVVSKCTTGSGTNEPKGIVTALDANTNVEVVVTTDGAFGAVDLYKVWDALPIRYRANASWMSSTDVQNEVRNFGSTMGSNFTVDLTQEDIPRLFGKRYFQNDYMDDFTGTTGAANLAVVGDFKNFLIAQRAGLTVELVPHLLGSNRRPSGQRGLFAYARIGSNSINDLGFRLLQNQ